MLEILRYSLAAMCAGFALNVVISTPRGIFDPAVAVPKFAAWFEKRLRKLYLNSHDAHKIAGILLMLSSLLIFAGIPAALLIILYRPAPMLAFLLDCYLCWAAFSVVGTKFALQKITRALNIGRLDLAQAGLSKLTGMDCSGMLEDELIKRSIECAADCGADNGVGTLFYMALGGGSAAMAYRTLSLLRRRYIIEAEDRDSFGRAAYKLWRIFDIIPAFICAELMKPTAALLRFETEECFDYYNRDRKAVDLVNLAPCRCFMACFLGVRLTSRAVQVGNSIRFLTVGDDTRPCEPDDILWATIIMYGAVFTALVVFAALKFGLIMLC
ncbi:MAG: cobalamin biosynthesis protein [Ruminococcus sp.]|nr:cobalamin biosynthesis protein [Ruminococcus sp.]